MRFWEIDFVRGLAIVFVVLFNYAFALDYLHVYTLTSGWLFWWLFPRIVAGMLIFISGVAAYVSYQKNKDKTRRIRRGAIIFGWGQIITLTSWLLVPSQTIWFGILHLIGLSIILSPFFIKFGKNNLLIGLSMIFIGLLLGNMTADFPWLLWLGIMPYGFSTLDYFPLLPWFGVFLIGMYLGGNLYRNDRRQFSVGKKLPGPIDFLGRHSLFIYLIHQPVLLLALYLLGVL